MSVLISLELRWFVAAPLPEPVATWFEDSLPGEASGVDERDDIYLYDPGSEQLGVKLRKKDQDSPYGLEIKWRELAAPFKGAHGVAGQFERWMKWGWKDPNGPAGDDIDRWAMPRGPWLTVRKKRRQRKYAWDGQRLVPAAPDELVQLGAAVEVTELVLLERPHGTVLVEAFAPDLNTQKVVLDAAIEQLFREFPMATAEDDRSFGYPQWLRRFGAMSSMRSDQGAARALRDDRLHELITTEYRYLNDQFIANEEMGEKRVGLFVSLTAGLGAAGVLAREKLGDSGPLSFPEVFVAVTVVWLLVGYATFLRIVHRNRATDQLKGQMTRLRGWFVQSGDHDGRALLPYDPYTPPEPRARPQFLGGKGGYAEVVSLVNSAVAGAIVWQAAHPIAELISPTSSAGGIGKLLGFAAAAIAAWWMWNWQADRAAAIYRGEKDGCDPKA